MDENEVEKTMTSLSWYDYSLNPGSAGIKNGNNTAVLRKDSEYSTDSSKITGSNSTGGKKQLTKEEDATEENGWISPMDFYKNHQAEYNNSRNVSNGMIQDLKYDANVFVYKDQYWWCEDLHNWCVYGSDCINYQFMNCFYLFVWNGKNAWVPMTNLYKPYGLHEFIPLQNKWCEQKIARGEVIYQTRGRFSNYNNWTNFDFGEGPLTVNHAFILKNTEKYSINSDQNFQTLRWSTPRHINLWTEYINFDGVNKITTDVGNIFSVKLKLSRKFGDKTDGTAGGANREKFYSHIGYEYINTDDADESFWYKVRRCNVTEDSDYSTSYWDWRVNSNGYLVGEEFDHKSDYENNDKTIKYDNVVASQSPGGGSWRDSEWFTDDDKETYGAQNLCHPLNHRSYKYNHIGLCPFAFEKVFACYLYKPDGRPVEQNVLNTDVTATCDVISWREGDVESGTEHKVYPIYLSYVDILFLFYHTTWSFTRPGNKTFNYETWKKRNSHLIQTLASMLRTSHDGKDWNFFKQDYATQKATVDNLVDSIKITSGKPCILWCDSIDKELHTFHANLYYFIDPNSISYSTNNHNKTTGSVGRKHDPLTVNMPPVYWLSWLCFYHKNEDNTYKLSTFGKYEGSSQYSTGYQGYDAQFGVFINGLYNVSFWEASDAEVRLEKYAADKSVLENGAYWVWWSNGGNNSTGSQVWGYGIPLLNSMTCQNDGVRAGMVWTNALRKYSLTIAGGGTLNGDSLYSSYKEEYDYCLENIRLESPNGEFWIS